MHGSSHATIIEDATRVSVPLIAPHFPQYDWQLPFCLALESILFIYIPHITMDGLAAFNLASSVIQVIDFSTKIVVKCHELYKYGASTENKEIESMAKHLTELATDLELPNTIQSPRSAPQLYRDDEELVKLGQQCSETAAELLGEVQKLSIQGRRRKRDAFRKAVKGIRKQSAIGDIQRRLGQYRMTLNTRILVNLRFVSLRSAVKLTELMGDEQ